MDIREPVEYYGLRVGIKYDGEWRENFLTGEETHFRVEIANKTQQREMGRLLIRWDLGNIRSFRVINFDVPGGCKRTYDLPKEWLGRPGIAIYKLPFRDPRQLLDDSEILEEVERGDFYYYTLCQYRVRDRATVEHEEAARKQEIRLMRVMLALTIMIGIFTVITCIIEILGRSWIRSVLGL